MEDPGINIQIPVGENWKKVRFQQKKKIYRLRCPKGPGWFFILLNLLYFSYQHNAVYHMLRLVPAVGRADPWVSSFLSMFLSPFLPKLMYPIAGWLSDAKFGRKKVFVAGACITWMAAVLQLAISAVGIAIPAIGDGPIAMGIIAVAYVFIAIGTACFHVNVLPFGIEQMEDYSSEEVGSFIHWYYLTRNINLGVLLQFSFSGTRFYCDANLQLKDQYDLLISLVQVAFLTVAVCLVFCFSKKLQSSHSICSHKNTPIRKIKDVTQHMLKYNHQVGYRRARTYTIDEKPGRLEFAKKNYGGCFVEKDVEEVATFWRLLVFLIPVGLAYFMVITGTYSYSSVFDHMKSDTSVTCANEYVITNMVYSITYAVCIPVYEFLIHPLFRNQIPRLVVKIGVGMIFMLAGYILLIAIDEADHAFAKNYDICVFYNSPGIPHLNISPYTIIPVIVLLTIGELFTIISSMEFICAQSPRSMRSLLIGLLYFIDGLGTGFASLLMLVIAMGFKSHTNHIWFSCCSSYYTTVLAFGFAGFIAYLKVAKWYKHRQFGEKYDIYDQSKVEEVYEQQIYQRNFSKSHKDEQQSACFMSCCCN